MRLDNPNTNLYNSIETVAFTGTQKGMTEAQCRKIRELLQKMKPRVLIHGDCVGADAVAHEIAQDLGIEVHIRPGNLKNKRAFTSGAKLLAPPENPLDRNPKMVDAAQALIACPSGKEQELRSGTWATIRYAKKVDTLHWIVYPDGEMAGPWGFEPF